MNAEDDRMIGTKRTILFGPYGKGGAIEVAARQDRAVIQRVHDERAAVAEYLTEARDVIGDREATDHYTHQLAAYDELTGELEVDGARVVIARYAPRDRDKRNRHPNR